ncbi:MAG: class I SAM-dependent methyltransferase [Bacteroidota bacterium]
MKQVKIKTPTIPERFTWAAGLLDIHPGENVLEIGCGVGLLAAEVAVKLISGRYYAVDPSPSRLVQAKKRNKQFVEEGIVNFQEAKFVDADLPVTFFHRVVAFNVNIFFQDPAPELCKVKNLLHPEGSLFLFYQAPFEIDLTAAAPAIKNLEENGFRIKDVPLKALQPTSALCIIAQAM